MVRIKRLSLAPFGFIYIMILIRIQTGKPNTTLLGDHVILKSHALVYFLETHDGERGLR